MHAHTPLFLSGLSLFALALSGCYTQLATRGYGSAADRGAAPAYAPSSSALPDSTYGDSDSAALAAGAPVEADTLAPRDDAPTVIVNNYYDRGSSYRGYSNWEWDYPTLSFGFYSSRYDHYTRPWWWNDPYYSRGYPDHRHHRHYRAYRPGPAGPVTPPGPYKSDKRLYNSDPSYPTVRKGRRSEQPVRVTPQPVAPDPAPAKSVRKSGGDGESTGNAGTSETSSGSSEPKQASETKAAPVETPKDADHPTLRKGRRR